MNDAQNKQNFRLYIESCLRNTPDTTVVENVPALADHLADELYAPLTQAGWTGEIPAVGRTAAAGSSPGAGFDTGSRL